MTGVLVWISSFAVGYAVLWAASGRLTGLQTVIALLVVTVPLCVPSLAVLSRRWHDRGKSGWFSLILLIPYLGAIWVFVELGFLPGDEKSNRYGEKPTIAWPDV